MSHGGEVGSNNKQTNMGGIKKKGQDLSHDIIIEWVSALNSHRPIVNYIYRHGK